MLVQAVVNEPLVNSTDIEHIRAQVSVLDNRTPGRLRLALLHDAGVPQLLEELKQDRDVYRASWQATTGSLLLLFKPSVLHRQLHARVVDLLADIIYCHQLCLPTDYDQRWQHIDWHHLTVEQVLEQISTLPAQPNDYEKTLELLTLLAYNQDAKARWVWAISHRFVRSYIDEKIAGKAFLSIFKHAMQAKELSLLRQLFAQRIQALEHISRVKRAGQWCNLARQDLQLGDLIEVKAGDQLAFDARLISSSNLLVEEGLASGFYQENLKQHQFTLNLAMPLDDRSNMLWAGSNVIAGSAQAIVVATGLETQMFKFLAQALVDSDAFADLVCFTQ